MTTFVESLRRLYQKDPAKYQTKVDNLYLEGKINGEEYTYITGQLPPRNE